MQSFPRSGSKKRTTNFREDETRLLIELWGSPQVQNKLYLTHRKAPVMRLLAANMQHRGFYRTPDEIKTRIRNLKCLYHRIKRSLQTGVGVGTVDPDWPHYKAMDEILSRKQSMRHDIYKDNVFDGPRCEDIKVEIMEDIDCNDNSLQAGSSTNHDSEADGEFEDEAAHPLPLLTPKPPPSDPTIAPKPSSKPAISTQPKSKSIDSLPRIMPKPVSELQAPRVTTTAPTNNVSAKVQIPIQTGIRPSNGSGATIPFPLLILNGLPGQNQQHQPQMPKKDTVPTMPSAESSRGPEYSSLLQSLLNVQTEQLHIQNQRLKLEKQQLKLNQLLTTQLLVLLPTLKNLLHRLVAREEQQGEGDEKSNKKRKLDNGEDEDDSLADCKVLKTMLEEGIKKYMLESIDDTDDDDDDSGIHKDVDK
nr:unnamed protein product [Callosobruchus analis]